jgi:hypothetical protein
VRREDRDDIEGLVPLEDQRHGAFHGLGRDGGAVDFEYAGPRPTDTGTPVDDRNYQVPFRFTGKIAKLAISIEPPKLTPADKKRLMEAFERAHDRRSPPAAAGDPATAASCACARWPGGVSDEADIGFEILLTK